MANRKIVLKTSNQQEKTYSKQVYVDIDLASKRVVQTRTNNNLVLGIENGTATIEQTNLAFENTNAEVVIQDTITEIQNINVMKLKKSMNVKAVFNSIQNMFSFVPGERILFPEFGNKLRQYLYKGILPQNIEMIENEIRRVCVTWEPRMNVVSISNTSSTEDVEQNIVRLSIVFTIPEIDNDQYEYSFSCPVLT